MIFSLMRRNIQLFFRDRAGVFFSLLGPLIMFILYMFFLGNLQKENIQEALPHSSTDNMNFFINSWIFAGILAITTVTTSLAAMQVFVADRASGRFKDFAVSPIKRSKIIIGYLGSTFVISLAMTSIVFGLSELYIVATGGNWLTWQHALSSYGVLALLCATFSALASFGATFIKSIAAFASLSVIIGTSVGFLAAVYVPLGSLPGGVTNVINVLPFSQATALLREPFVQQSTAAVTSGNTEATTKLSEFYGISLKVGDYTLASSLLISIIIGMFVVFALAAMWRINRRLK